MSRAARLQAATRWIAEYRGKNLVRGYRKWFGVSDVCAVLELRMLGVDIPDARLEQARRDEQVWAAHRARRAQRSTQPSTSAGGYGELDALFAFIAGYTEGGAPYDITREETGEAGDQDEDESLPF
jgi:hypothetical protein